MSSLPIVEFQTYELILPVSGLTVRYRPYIVKEQKQLATALEFSDNSSQQVTSTIQSIVEACTFNKVDIDSLSNSDLEYLFLHIKAKSTGENLSVTYTCRNIVEVKEETIEDSESSQETEIKYKECGTSIHVPINLVKTEVINKDTSRVIKIDPQTGMILKFPNFGIFRKNINIFENNLTFEEVSKLIYSCIESIYTNDSSIKPELDFSEEEFINFLDTLTPEILNSIISFFENLPKVKYTLKLKCPSCKTEEEIILSGLDDFLE